VLSSYQSFSIFRFDTIVVYEVRKLRLLSPLLNGFPPLPPS
jgi:hypothetical protein